MQIIPQWGTIDRSITTTYDTDVFDKTTFNFYAETNYPGYELMYTDGSKVAGMKHQLALQCMNSPHKLHTYKSFRNLIKST